MQLSLAGVGLLLLSWSAAGATYSSSILLPVSNRAVSDELFRLTSPNKGVTFDRDGDGTKEQTAWTAAGADVGFLTLDRNDNGTIDDGRELFGDHTYPGVDNGFEALSRTARSFRRDNPPAAMVDSDNPLYQQLVIWVDRDHNGISAASELSRVVDIYDVFCIVSN